jgi:hypothetical protein
MSGFTFDSGASYAWKVRSCRNTSCTIVSSWSSQRIFWWIHR